jgi:hypothetical protein
VLLLITAHEHLQHASRVAAPASFGLLQPLTLHSVIHLADVTPLSGGCTSLIC